MPSQDPAHGAHLTLPAEVERLTKAVEFFASQGDQKQVALLTPQLEGAKERLVHAANAAAFVEKLGLSHKVTTSGYTVNDAINVVARVLHEHEHHESGKHDIKPLYVRAHAHVKNANDGAHCDAAKFCAKRDSHAELVEHLGLTDPKHIEAAKALFQKVTV